ncbi:MAG TPA: polysaccharide biosynthesis/export family protein [Candidatus Acidoferrum sp.]|nr:polysaccharide biosynthesis/export family protein [Candidatus Acidoferrum sp.]
MLSKAMVFLRRTLWIASVFALALLCCRPATAQLPVDTLPPPNPPSQAPETAAPPTYDGYMVGVGDVLQVRVIDEDDVSGQYQVNASGNIQVPLLSKPIHAAGLSTFELSTKLSDALKTQGILKQPEVTVFILRSMSHNVTILGAVSRPGVYPLEKQNTTLLDAISLSGGLLSTAGPTVTITHHATASGSGKDSSTEPVTGVETVDVRKLITGNDPKLNVPVQAGDVITVSDAPIVYVVGAVTKPGAFTVEDGRNGITVLQALALVQGTTSTAKLKSAMIVRQSDNGANRKNIPVNLTKVMRGKTIDPVLEANDILFVPESGFKQGMQKAGDVAVQAASEVAGYGLGLRIAK